MTDPKFSINSIVNGKHYGVFAIFGRSWCDVAREWVYEVRQVNNASEQRLVSKQLNLIESCLA